MYESQKKKLTPKQKDILREATHEKLVAYFKEKHTTKEEETSFGKKNALKLDMFENFLNGSERYVAARFAIFNMLALD